jgi:hypothetical protein
LLTLGKTLTSSSKLVVMTHGAADVAETLKFLQYPDTAGSMFPRWVFMQSLLCELWLNLDVRIMKDQVAYRNGD